MWSGWSRWPKGGPGGEVIRVFRVLRVAQVSKVVQVVQVVRMVMVVLMVRVVGFDDMRSDDMWFTWTKPSNVKSLRKLEMARLCHMGGRAQEKWKKRSILLWKNSQKHKIHKKHILQMTANAKIKKTLQNTIKNTNKRIQQESTAGLDFWPIDFGVLEGSWRFWMFLDYILADSGRF